MKVSFNSVGSLYKSVGQRTYEDIWQNLRYSYLDRIDCEEAIDAYKDGNYTRAEKLLPKDVFKDLLWDVETSIGHANLAKALINHQRKESNAKIT